MYSKAAAVLLLAIFSLHATAEVIRSVDKEGNVTFSDLPTLDSVKSKRIKIDESAPQGERLTDSQQEAQAIINKANRLQKKQDTASQNRAIQNKVSSGNQLENARKRLETSRIVGPGDRIGKVGGGTRLTSEYLERVKQAEQAVREAEREARKNR